MAPMLGADDEVDENKLDDDDDEGEGEGTTRKKRGAGAKADGAAGGTSRTDSYLSKSSASIASLTGAGDRVYAEFRK